MSLNEEQERRRRVSIPFLSDESRRTLFINRNDSVCGGCGGNAFPREKRHLSTGRFKGCGVEWEYVSSLYLGMKERVVEMRPDLEYISEWEYPVG